MNKKNLSDTTSAPATEINRAADTEAFLAELGLPESTTDKELSVILQANAGASLPFKSAVFLALLRLIMVDGGLPENGAREYLTKKFPMLIVPDARHHSETAAADLLREQLIKIYCLRNDASEHDIAKAAQESTDFIAAEKARRAQEEADEAVITTKMRLGLTREQAINVIKRQRDHEVADRLAREKRRPRLIQIIKKFPNDLGAARLAANSEFNTTGWNAAEFSEAVAAVTEV